MRLPEGGGIVGGGMLSDAASVQAGQILGQFGGGHGAVLRNKGERQSAGHPDEGFSTGKSSQYPRQAAQSVQRQHRILVLRVRHLRALKSLDCGLRGDKRSSASASETGDTCVAAAIARWQRTRIKRRNR